MLLCIAAHGRFMEYRNPNLESFYDLFRKVARLCNLLPSTDALDLKKSAWKVLFEDIVEQLKEDGNYCLGNKYQLSWFWQSKRNTYGKQIEKFLGFTPSELFM